MFMVVMNIRSAIISESTLSFMGIGLPLEIISWGSMLSLAEKSPPDQFLVDHPHPRNLPDNNLALYDKHWKLPAKEWKPEGK